MKRRVWSIIWDDYSIKGKNGIVLETIQMEQKQQKTEYPQNIKSII